MALIETDTYTSGTSRDFPINGKVTICIDGDTLNTTVEYKPTGASSWFTLQQEVGTDTTVVSKSVFQVELPSGDIRFNGGTNVNVIVNPE